MSLTEIKKTPEKWMELVERQTNSGKYWLELFTESFNSEMFLTRSDSIGICQTAQIDALKLAIEKNSFAFTSNVKNSQYLY